MRWPNNATRMRGTPRPSSSLPQPKLRVLKPQSVYFRIVSYAHFSGMPNCLTFVSR